MRRAVARRMSASNRDIPQFSVSAVVRMDEALEFIEATLAESPGLRLTPTAVIVAAAASALAEHPRLNACWDEDELYIHDDVNIGVAVAVDGGLVAPAILDTGTLTIVDLAEALVDLGRRARDAKLRPAELTSATFTVSNLGMFGVSSFTALVTPPQVAILAVSSIAAVPELENDGWQAARVLTATLSCDHRAVDGADAARYLASFRRALTESLSDGTTISQATSIS